MRRIIGFVMLFSGIFGLGLTVAGVGFLFGLVDRIEAYLTTTFTDAQTSLQASETTLNQTLIIIDNTVLGLEGIEEGLRQTGETLTGTEPILATIRTLAVTDVPQSLTFVIDSLESAVTALESVDATLTTLANFELDLPGPLPTVRLNIPYDPAAPLHTSVDEARVNIIDVSSGLQSLDKPLEDTRQSAVVVGDNLGNVSRSVKTVKQSFADSRLIVENLKASLIRLKDRTQSSAASVTEYTNPARLAFAVLLIWLGFAQVAPLYLGWSLVRGPSSPSVR